ncbi:hypothetical protein WJX73_005195 [Symbiochloris irregularis]|uniref:Glycosyltransferase 61 catalytic domain-containing protein n=1 Tax=Symbiochloris irregularis TaxID=706552 RepID=A0AAW1P1D0_9CHLO
MSAADPLSGPRRAVRSRNQPGPARLAQLGAPRNSTVVYRSPQQYVEFHNVMLKENGLVFYLPDEAAEKPDASHVIPNMSQILSWQYWDNFADFKVEVVSKHNRSQFPQTCMRWVKAPTIIYSGAEVDAFNMFHFFADNLARVFTTAIKTGIINMDAFMARSALPSSKEANFILLQRRPISWASKFHEFFDHLTPDQWTSPRGNGYCFRTLIVGIDHALTPYFVQSDAEGQKRSHALMTQFQRFAMTAQMRTEVLKGNVTIPADLFQAQEPLAPGQKLRLGYIHRKMGGWNSRAIINEQELLEAMRARYKDTVEIEVFDFNMTLLQAMVAVRKLNVLVGMHGAGLTNLLWLHPGSSVVQLIPHGWDGFRRGNLTELRVNGSDTNNIFGAALFAQTANNVGCHPFLWQNVRPENAYFFEDPEEIYRTSEPFREHPQEGDALAGRQWEDVKYPHGENILKRTWWYQNTMVDLDTLLPVIDDAIEAAKASLESLHHHHSANETVIL